MKVNLIGRVRNTPLPKTQGLLPVFEAIINSIDAIEDTGKDISEEGKITIRVLRKLGLDLKQDEGHTHEPINGFEIEDNGIGFNENNFSSFNEADSQHKAQRGGKGIGRFLWLKAFKTVEVDSTFIENDITMRRTFRFSLASPDGISNHEIREEHETKQIRTIVKLLDFDDAYEANIPRTGETIAQRILEHCLEYFVLTKAPIVEFIDEDDLEIINLDSLYDNLVSNSEKNTYTIKKQTFHVNHFYLQAWSGLHHHVSYCADRRVVTSDNIKPKISNLPSTISINDNEESLIYAGYISSNYLDTHVNPLRTGFETLPDDATLFDSEISLSEIKEETLEVIKGQLAPFTSRIQAKKEERIRAYINNNAPEYRHIIKNHNGELEQIEPDISDKVLDRELYEIHREIEDKLKQKTKDLLDDLSENDDYEEQWEKFSEYLGEFNDVGKSNLAKYILHRKTILSLLDNALKIQDDEKFSKEAAIHEFIFPLRKTSDDITYDDHNLWIIDEKLAYHYYLASDLPLSQIDVLENNSESRPDLILFYDNAFAMAEDEPPYNSGIVIFEFKRPMRDNYNDDENPIAQVFQYVEEIRNGDKKDKNRRTMNISPTVPFYCYIIADITNNLKKQAKFYGLRPTPDSGGYFGYNDQLNVYIEIIGFEKLISDSKKRNRILFDKLNLNG